MNIVYLGADVPSNRVVLEKMSVTHMAVSFWGVLRRGAPKTKKYLLENYFSDNVVIHVHPGIPATTRLSGQDLEDFCVEYETFIADNLHRINLFSEIQHPDLPEGFVDEQRRSCWAEVPEEKFAVVYTDGDLESLATRYLNVCVPGSMLEDRPELIGQIRRFSDQHGTRFHALGVAKPDLMRNTPFETMATLSWLSPMMRGETIVWYGNALTRYPKRMKEQARSRYKSVYEKANLDFDKILADDATEVTKLAIWSYQQLEAWNNRTDLVTMSDETLPHENAESTPSDVTKRGTGMRKLEPRNPDEIRTLPVLGVELTRSIETDENGIDVLRDIPIIKSNSTSLRVCNTCFVKDNCPAFKPDNTCAFNLPVELKTKEQYKAFINAFLEMQGQRVAFAKFTEDLNGGYPDPNVGQELDRFFKMLKTIKELDDSKEMIRMTVERSGSSGVLSALFGERAQTLNELPNGGVSENQQKEIFNRINPDES